MTSSSWLDDPNYVVAIPRPQPQQPRAISIPNGLGPWIPYVLIGILAIALAWMWSNRPTSDDSPSPVNMETLHVLIMHESEERDELRPEQLSVLNSIKVRRRVEELGGKLRVFDEDDDLRSVEPEWRALAQSATLGVPFVVVGKGRKVVQFDLQDVDTTIERIESVGGKRK